MDGISRYSAAKTQHAKPLSSGTIFGVSEKPQSYDQILSIDVRTYEISFSSVNNVGTVTFLDATWDDFTFPNNPWYMAIKKYRMLYLFASTASNDFSYIYGSKILSSSENSISVELDVMNNNYAFAPLAVYEYISITLGQFDTNFVLGYNSGTISGTKELKENLNSSIIIGNNSITNTKTGYIGQLISIGENSGNGLKDSSSTIIVGNNSVQNSESLYQGIVIGNNSGSFIPAFVDNVTIIGNSSDGSSLNSNETIIQGGTKPDAIKIRAEGVVSTQYQPSYSGDNTASASHVTYSGEAVKPPTTHINIGSAWNVTNGRFTSPVDGYYFCSFNSLINRPLNTSHAYVEFQVNGVRKSARAHTPYDIYGNYIELNNSAIIYCPANNYITCNLWTMLSAQAYGGIYGLGLNIRYLG